MSSNEDEPFAVEAKLLDTFSFVLSFLRDVGLVHAEQALVEEISEKYPELGPTMAELEELGTDREVSDKERAVCPGVEKTPLASSAGTAQGPHQAIRQKSIGATVVPKQSLSRGASSQDLHRISYPGIPAPWGTDVNEYVDMDDVGYRRNSVSNQEQFVELEVANEEGEESEPYFVHSSKATNAHSDVQGSDSDSEQDLQPSPQSSSRHSPTQMPPALMAALSGKLAAEAAHGMHVVRKPAADETWDMGPTDIKMAEPVITPGKSMDRSTDDQRPVLSRVESLSSSFKDFDLERLDLDDQLMGRGSQPSETEMLSDADVIDFLPSAVTDLGAIVPEDLEMFTRGSKTSGLSRTSSTDVAHLACATHEGHASKEDHAEEPPQEMRKGPDAQKETVGGFSFPVTPSADEMDGKLFKSWPSVRSSSTSERVPTLDDISATSDYADDGYRSKLSSRTPSQGYAEEARDRPSGSPKQQQVRPVSDSGIYSRREASLDLPATTTVSGGSKSPSVGAAYHDDSTASSPEQRQAAEAGPGSPAREPQQEAEPGETGVSEAPDDEPCTPTQGAGTTAAGTAGAAGKQPGEVSAHRISVEELDASPGASAGSAGEQDQRTSDDSGSSAGDADSASLVGEPCDAPVDWQEAPEETEDAEGVEGIPGSAADMDQNLPKYTIDESGAVTYHYDMDFINSKYEVFPLQIIHRRHRTGFEETKDFPIRMNDLIAGRYQVMDFLGSAAFSRAVQALDVKTNSLVCLKIVKNNKDYFDQSLDEIKLLKFVNSCDPNDEHGIVRLYDYFYYKEHLFLVCELLRANLYEFQKYNKESGEELYFTNARIQKIAISVLKSLAYLHSLDLIHSDLKPENILIKSYSRCEVKVIDLGSSCFTTDQLSSYVQSRSYRAPEVILGLPYDHKVDIWSLGCILAELSSGYVLLQNDSVATLLARLEGILGAIPSWMTKKGRYASRFFTRSGDLFEKVQQQQTGAPERYELLVPKKTSLRHRVPDADTGLLSFIAYLLNVDPHKRPSAAEALGHPWLQHTYASMDSMS